eukprot:829543_1
MKSIIALLFGLLSISYATEDEDDSGEQFSWDSAASVEGDGATQSYKGLIIQVYQPDGEALIVTLSSRKDVDRVYCLNFARIFEATGYTDATCTEDCTYEEVDGTQVDLADANCVVTDNGDGQTFSAVCTPVPDATLTLNFAFKENTATGDYGIEYTIDLQGYTMQTESTSFVMEQTIKECSDKYANSGDSGDDSDDQGEDEDGDEGDNQTRRLLGDDGEDSQGEDEDSNDDESDSADEESGISSDDSKEFDVDAGRFLAAGVACNECVDDGHACTDDANSAVDFRMVYQRNDKALQLVFAPFTCNLYVDPFFGIDNSKLGSGNMMKSGIAIVIGIAMLLF